MDISKKINQIAEHFFKGNNVSFANEMGTSEANIRNYRKSTVPKVDFLIDMCHALEISYEWLFDDVGSMKKKKRDFPEAAEPSEVENYGKPKYDVNRDETIAALHKVITAQDKTISALEELLANKSTSKETREYDNPRTI